MAKKPTKPEKPEEPAEELTEGTAAAKAEQPGIPWPESTETRELNVDLTDEEAHEEALKLIHQLQRVDKLGKEKKASAKEFDTQIGEAETEIARLQAIVLSKQDRREVACHWVFEANGLNDLGNANHHTGMKTLVRDDTGTVVEVLPITGDDRQMVLPISDEEQHADNLAKLKALGYTVGESSDDIEHDAAFQAVNPEKGHTLPIYADNLAEAAAIAVAELTREPEPAAA